MGEMVEFPGNGGAGGYLAMPHGGGGPGVVVIQEYWGLVPHIEEVCDRFAAAGFVALAPDLFHGDKAALSEPDKAGKLLMELRLDRAAREMVAAGGWLAAHERVAGDRVGIVGFCLGGALALYAASLSDVFTAVVSFYPYFAATAEAQPDHAKIRGAVLGHFAELDHAYSRGQVDGLAQQLRDAGVDAEFQWYPGADHAFFNDTRPEVYSPEAAQQAWERTVSFLRKRLAATPAPV